MTHDRSRRSHDLVPLARDIDDAGCAGMTKEVIRH